MKRIRTEDAVGQVLCHDMTRTVRGESHGPQFRKGHVIKEEDIPMLLSMGKDTVYIWESDENSLHENDAAELLRDLLAGENILASYPPREGKIELFADADGVLLVDSARVNAINALGEIVIATRHGNFAVLRGDKLAGTRVVPLVIAREKMERAKALAGSEPLLRVAPFVKKRAGVITTGNEVFYGRIEDTFTPVLRDKFAEFGATVEMHQILGDDPAAISAAIREMLSAGMDIVACTGGMSVDPDDRTPLAIRESGARIVSYGAPVLPGAMFLLAYAPDGRPVVGLPGCVMYARRTIFDLMLPRLMAGVPVSAAELSNLGEGGLCLNCEICTFPNCGFGK